MISPTGPIALGINRLTSALYERSKGAGELPAKRFREIPDGQIYNPQCLSGTHNWRRPGSSYIIEGYSFQPLLEVTEKGEVFDLDPNTLERHYSVADSPDALAKSLAA